MRKSSCKPSKLVFPFRQQCLEPPLKLPIMAVRNEFPENAFKFNFINVWNSSCVSVSVIQGWMKPQTCYRWLSGK